MLEGIKYNVVITAGEKTLFDQNVIGAAEPVESEVAVTINGETALNTHSAVTAGLIENFEVTFDGVVPSQAYYSINSLKEVAGEESSTWEFDATLAQGEVSLNGKGYVELDEAITLEAGTKYNVIINYVAGSDNGEAVFEINGSFSEAGQLEVALVNGEEENTINAHSSVSVDVANAIKVNVINTPQAVGISYVINEMNQNEDEEGTFWTVGKELAAGEANLNSIAYAELDSTIYFAQGTKYQVSVTVYDQNGEMGAPYIYEINGSYAEVMEIAASLMLGDEETAINAHSSVSVDAADAIKVNVINAPEAVGISYIINEMNYNEDEEGAFWTVGKELAVGEANLNGIAYAELDSTLYFAQGTKYQVSVTVYDQNGEMGAPYIYEINGSYAEEMEIAASLMLGEEETAINSHSSVSVDAADAIKVNVINAPQAVGISYVINEMNYNEDEEGAFWTVGKELALGEANLNGIAYAELDSTIYFAQGTKYQVSVTVYDRNGEMGAPYIYEINGSYAEEIEIAAALMLGEEEIAINSHSSVSVDAADAIKVNVINAPEAVGISYIINEMNYNEDEEGAFWTVGAELAAGEANLNGIAYAQLDSTLYFAQGTKYQIAVTVYDQNGEMGAPYIYEINGSYEEAPELAVSLIANEETEYLLNTHSYVTIDSPISAIKVAGLDQTLETITYAIYDKRETLAEGTLSVNTIGYAEFDEITLYEGIMYNVVLKIGEEVIYDNYVIGAVEEAPESMLAYVLAGNLFSLQSEGKNLNFNNQDVAWTDEPSNFQFAIEAPEALEGEDYTNKYVLRIYENGQPRDFWGQQAHYLNFQPEGGSVIFGLWNNGQNGTDVKNGAVFTIEETENGLAFKNVARGLYLSANGMSKEQASVIVSEYGPNAINSIATASKANGKYIENGKVVIVKNGVKYNVAGSIIK